jgi:DNA-binding NarL/FixJ family response regulator
MGWSVGGAAQRLWAALRAGGPESGWLDRLITSAVIIGMLGTARAPAGWVWVCWGVTVAGWVVFLICADRRRVLPQVGLAVAAAAAALTTGVDDSTGLVLTFVVVAMFTALPSSPPLLSLGVVATATALITAAELAAGASMAKVGLYVGIAAFTTLTALYRRQFHVRALEVAQLLELTRDAQAERARAAALDERTRIARELHDVLAHSLGALGVQLELATALLESGDSGEALERVRRARRLAADGLDEARAAVKRAAQRRRPAPTGAGRARGTPRPRPHRRLRPHRGARRRPPGARGGRGGAHGRRPGGPDQRGAARAGRPAARGAGVPRRVGDPHRRQRTVAPAGRPALGAAGCGAHRHAGAARARRRQAAGGRGRPGVDGRGGGAGVTGEVRVLVVDDQAVVRDGLVALLGLADGIEVAGAAGDGQEALDLLGRVECDVVLMDLRMPVLDGVAATARIAREHPSVGVLVLTTYADDDSVAAALAAGARGYLTKNAGRAEIAAAIRSAAAGQSTFDAGVAGRLVAALVDRTGGEPVAPERDGLTVREREVLTLIAKGLSNAEIAAALFVGQSTVKTHINNAFAKIGATNRADAVRYAYRAGLAGP